MSCIQKQLHANKSEDGSHRQALRHGILADDYNLLRKDYISKTDTPPFGQLLSMTLLQRPPLTMFDPP